MMRAENNPPRPPFPRGEVERSVNRGDSVLVIGCGNRLRGDDGVGLELALELTRSLKPCLPEHITIVTFEGEPIELLELWRGFDRVVLLDAARSGAPPGTLHTFDVHRQPLPATFQGHSSHAFALSAAIELARALNQLPPDLTVYGVEGSSFTLGEGLSDAFKAKVPTLRDCILADLIPRETFPRVEKETPMNHVDITGRNVEITEAMRSYLTERFGKLTRYSGDIFGTKVVISYEANPKVKAPVKVEAHLKVPQGVIRAEERSDDAYAAMDKVATRLERQLKRRAERQASFNAKVNADLPAKHRADTHLPDEVEDDAHALPAGTGMDSIARVKRHVLRPMSPDDATLAMDASGHGFYMFCNAATCEINVVYMRHDGTYGLLEPAS